MANKWKKTEIDAYDYLGDIIKGVKRGALITTKYENKVNSMAISWGQLGIEWERLIFTCYVRTGRYTHELLSKSKAFTLNVRKEEKVGKIIGFCGTKSGREVNKADELGFILVESNNVDVPGIKQLPLTLECKVIYSQLQDETGIPDDLKTVFYPQEVTGEYHGANRDFHTMFYGEVVGAYVIEEDND